MMVLLVVIICLMLRKIVLLQSVVDNAKIELFVAKSTIIGLRTDLKNSGEPKIVYINVEPCTLRGFDKFKL